MLPPLLPEVSSPLLCWYRSLNNCSRIHHCWGFGEGEEVCAGVGLVFSSHACFNISCTYGARLRTSVLKSTRADSGPGVPHMLCDLSPNPSITQWLRGLFQSISKNGFSENTLSRQQPSLPPELFCIVLYSVSLVNVINHNPRPCKTAFKI